MDKKSFNDSYLYFRLAGHAAVKAKNVCLQLVDEHSDITDSGLVQLFSYPHPQKTISSAFWSKSPPKIYVQKQSKSSKFTLFL